MKTWGRVILALGMLMHKLAWANIGAGGSRWPLVDFFIEGYEVIGGVYLPFLCLALFLATLINMGCGYVRMGSGLSKFLLIVFAAGTGVTGLAELLGVDVAIGLRG